jgi:Uma2 family endonuclease
MAPAPNDEHQDIGGGFVEVFRTVIDRARRGKTRPCINLAIDVNHWEDDYRVPDVAVFLDGSSAICHGAFWAGPPDFVVEIISPYDKTREKLEFYSRLGTRELLIVDRDPWQLELYQLQRAKLENVASISLGDSAPIVSDVLPLSFRLTDGSLRPSIEVVSNSGQSWLI